MHTRRTFLKHAPALALAGTSVTGCTSPSGLARYEAAVKSTWRHFGSEPAPGPSIGRELVRYATLAASSHNSQPWRFRVQDNRIAILPDLTRRCQVVDPDDHHLFVSLGCATENLILAAQALGLRASAHFQPSVGEVLDVETVDLERAPRVVSPLFDAIPRRQCTRAEYDGKPVPAEYIKLLEEAGRGKGVATIVFTGKEQIENVLEYVVQGNSAQLDDPNFVEELKNWLRFNEDDALETGDGLFSRTSGSQVVPRWLGRMLLRFVYTARAQNDVYAKHIRSCAGIIVFVSEENDKPYWVEAGRCYQRFALRATVLGLRNAFLNQPVEVPELRSQFASYLGIGDRRPNLVVRFGHGPQMPRSLRRAVAEVII